MNTFDCIVSEMKSFVEKFPKTRVRYEHDTIAKTHFVEVVPNEIYHLNNSYIQWESDFFDRFISQYPNENICFISDDAIVGLDRVDFELCGIEFISNYSAKEEGKMLFDTISVLIQQRTVSKEIIPTYNECKSQPVDFKPTTIDNYSPYQLAA